MTLFCAKIDRRILPRWRDSQNIGTSADLQSLKAPKRVEVDMTSTIPDLTSQFHDDPNLGTAAELISSSLLDGNADPAFRAAEFVLARRDQAPKALIAMAEGLVGDTQPFRLPQDETEQVKVARTRQLLQMQPRNPLLWSDMARHHAAFGDKPRAAKCMKVALALAPNHRWMLRTAARFLVHGGNAAAAQRLLVSHARTKSDPWLVAAELACAQVAGRPPKFWRQAKDFIRHTALHPRHLSELATAVAMMELESGERKQARRLVLRGLIDPTENTLAQVFWAIEHRHLNDGFGLDELVRKRSDAYEADYQLSINAGDIASALSSARTWLEDEPFAARPCMGISYVATLLDDYSTACDMERRVKTIDNKVPATLELNAIYAELSSGRLSWEQDADRLNRIFARLHTIVEQQDADPYHAIADIGLWYYRFGSADKGYKAYQAAIESAQRLRQLDAAAAAAVFAAREAILAKDPRAPLVLKQAQDLMPRSPSKACEFYLRKVEALSDCPEDSATILTPQSAQRFMLTTPTKAPNVRFKITKQGATIWVPKRG